LLDKKWDLTLTDSGLIALADSEAYTTAQNVANECRRFLHDSYFDHDAGIPHFMIELGQKAKISDAAVRTALRTAALRVADVERVLDVEFEAFDSVTRALTGRITFTCKSTGTAQTVRI
jgi:hypothetical protein